MGKGRSQETSADSGQIEDQRQQEDPDLILVDERNQQPEVENLVLVDQRQEERHFSLFEQILAYHDQRRQAAGRQAGLNRWEILVVVLLVFACVGPVLPVVAMVVKLLTETREEEEG